ncbi:MAG TPA: hypothetical protein DHM37_03240 [Candidatus Cloacimonas sp.]|jgi:hypothetical protein|nr:hypothetical protein [Candidatus Cloacimonas sp.]
MKKSLIILLTLAMSLALVAHEVSIGKEFLDSYDTDGDGVTEKGFYANQIRLGFTGEDYSLGMDFTKYFRHGYENMKDIELKSAWKSFDMYGYADFIVGYDSYEFGRITTSLASQNMSIYQLYVPQKNWMLKLKGDVSFVDWTIYYPYDTAVTKDLGGQLGFNVKNGRLGLSLLARDVMENWGGRWIDYAVDLEYTIPNIVKIAGQVYEIDDDLDNTDDIDFYVIANYSPGFELPPLFGRNNPNFGILDGVFKPYVGYATYRDAAGDGMGENYTLAGLNFETRVNAFWKLEYMICSEDDIDDRLALQIGYHF